MIIVLQNQADDGPLFYLQPNKQYTVGRKHADIVIQNDESISRQHALIKVGSVNDAGIVRIIDCKSKYGTFVNNKKLAANTEVVLQDTTTIKFGVFQSIYTVHTIKFTTTGSSLSDTVKSELKSLLSEIGATFVNSWSSSITHLTVEEISVTLKVLQALLDAKPMVVPDFWRKVADSLRHNKPLPNARDFKPALAEELFYDNTSTQIDVDPKRATLFEGKTFIFATEKIWKRMVELIAKTGGDSFAWEWKQLDFATMAKTPDKFLFVRDTNENVSEPLAKIHKLWEQQVRYRVVPVTEIATAIFFSSCEKHCNAKMSVNVFKHETEDEAASPSILAPETPAELLEIQAKREPKSEAVVPGSLDEDVTYEGTFKKPKAPLLQSTLNSWKRPADQTNSQDFQKRIKLETDPVNTPKTPSQTLKRKSVTTPESSPLAKKTPPNRTAFSITNKGTKGTVPNPFAHLKRDVTISPDNPFARKSDSTRVSSSNTSQNRNASSLDVISPKTQSSGKWTLISDQKVGDNRSSGKTSFLRKGSSMSLSEVDDEFKEIYQKYSEKFKNSVIIEQVPMVVRGRTVAVDTTDSGSGAGRNFKKFKKVMPIRPSSRSILPTNEVVCNSRNLTFDESRIQVESDYDEDDEEEEIRASARSQMSLQKQRVATNRFNVQF